MVQVVNLQMRITDRQGGDAIDVPLPDFFLLPTSPTTFDSDGRVIYDSLHGRWLAAESELGLRYLGGASFGNGYIDFAVSETADPTGDWEVHFLAFDDKLPDFPAPGTSTDKVGFASNMFSMTTGPACVNALTFSAGHISIMDWSDLTNGGGVTVAGTDLDVFSTAIRSPGSRHEQHAPGSGRRGADRDVDRWRRLPRVDGDRGGRQRHDRARRSPLGPRRRGRVP